MELFLISGIIGMLFILAGLFLVLFHEIRSNSKAYLWLNIIGGLLLFFYSFQLKSIPFMILQGIWVILPAYKLLFHKK